MRWLNETNLRNKLIFITMATSAVALLLTGSVFVVRDFVRLRSDTSEQLQILAGIVGNNSTSALMFEDVDSAAETLRTVLADDSVVCAHLFDAAHNPFTSYMRGTSSNHDHDPLIDGREGEHWSANGLEVVRPIYQDGERVGTVQIAKRLDRFWSGLIINAGIVVLVMIGALCVAFALSGAFQSVISTPILQLVETMRRVSEEKDFSTRVDVQSGAELGMLVAGFNDMLQEIETRDQELMEHSEVLEEEVAQRTGELTTINADLVAEISEREKVEAEREFLTDKLMEAARKAGQAEVATGVLHNVGNVLNSVNVSATLLEERLRSQRLSGLDKTVGLLREHESELSDFLTTDARGQKLPAYLGQLSEKLSEERDECIEQLQSLLKDIDHIKTIVKMQQGYAKGTRITERIPLSEIVESSLDINRNSLERHHINVIREYGDVPELETDKHHAIQILVNLFSNAINSLKQTDDEDRQLIVRVGPAGETSAQIQIIDNGIGLSPEGLRRVFQYGYTTREDGHGFGLHSGALAAAELGGSLKADSDGPGTGACFTLELPYEIPTQKAS